MSTDVANLAQNMPAFLQSADNSALQEFTGGVAGGMPLASMSFRGKEWRVRKDGQEYNTRQRDLEVVMIASRPHVSKRYYAESYSAGETSAPDCSSVDGVTPDVAEPVNDKCSTCPMNAWGSQVTASGKQGKACSDYKRIVVLPIVNGQAFKEPAVLDVPATSLKTPKGYQGHELFLREYMGTLAKHQIPPHGVVTTIGFTDAEYPQLQFQLSHYVSEEMFRHAEELRDAEEVREVLDGPAHETSGSVSQTQAPPQQAEPEPQKAEPAPEPAPAPEPEPAPQPGTTEDAGQTEQATASPGERAEQGEDVSEDDILGEIDNILGG